MKCYCGRDKDFNACCEKYLKGIETPKTPEDLMRSRYSAYCTKDMAYLVATTDAQARFEIDQKGNREWADQAKFTHLEILKTEENGPKGIVEFKASFSLQGQPEIHHEVSTFRKTNGIWYFRSGRVLKT